MPVKKKKSTSKKNLSKKKKFNVAPFHILILLVVATVGIFFALTAHKSSVLSASYDPSTGVFHETFDGNPDRPVPYTNLEQGEWDIAVHSRDADTFNTLHTMNAHHGHDCSAPLDASGNLVTHATDGSYQGSVFKCKDHVMTSLNESGYGVIYITPNYLANITDQTTTIKFDVSTLRSSSRDWIDLWLTPYADNMQLPLDEWLPDLQGKPKNGIHIKGDQGIFKVFVIRDYQETEITKNSWIQYDSILTQSPKDRATFELSISKNHIKFGLPEQPLTQNRSLYWADSAIEDLSWNQAVVQLGHHSYNPEKDCNIANNPGPDGTCKPNTWHWDNVRISNATPFTIIKSDKRVISPTDPTLNLKAPAPSNAHLRFSALGNVDISFDSGSSWSKAVRQPGSAEASGGHRVNQFSSYWTPIPEGTTTVQFKFSADGWYNGAWPYLAKDLSVWANNNAVVSQDPTPTVPDQEVTPTATPLPTATPTSTPVPTATPTPTVVTGNQITVKRVLTVKNHDSSLTGTSYNNNSNTAKIGKDGSKGVNNFNLFSSINIPRSAYIVSADISYELVGYGGGTVNALIAAHDTGEATHPTSKSQFESKQSQLTSAKVGWNNVSQGDWGTKIKSPNISSVIQEIVNRSDWNSGNSILLWIGDNKSTNWAHSSFMTANFTGAGQKPTLTITYIEQEAN